MRFNWLRLVYLLVTCLPLMSGAQSSCRGVFTRPPNRLERELVMQIPHGDRTVDSKKLGRTLLRAGRARLRELGVVVEEQPSAYGEMMLVIQPDDHSEYGRLASKMKQAYGGELIFDPARLVDVGAEGLAGVAVEENGQHKPVLFIGAASLFSDRRLLRDLTILHELRHLRLMINELKGIASPFYGEVEAKVGRIPYKLDPGESDYANYLSFSEMRTYHGEFRQNLIELRRRIRRGLPFDHVIDDAYSSLTYRSIVSHRSLAAVKAAKKAVPTFNGQKATIIAHADGAVLRLDIPVLDKTMKREDALAMQLDWLRSTAYDLAKQSERLLPEVQSIRTVDDVDAILRQLPVNP